MTELTFEAPLLKATVSKQLEQARCWGEMFTQATNLKTNYVEFDGDEPDGCPKLNVMLEPDVSIKRVNVPVIDGMVIRLTGVGTFRFARMQSGYKNGRRAVIELVYEQSLEP